MKWFKKKKAKSMDGYNNNYNDDTNNGYNNYNDPWLNDPQLYQNQLRQQHQRYHHHQPPPLDWSAKLPAPLLERIFTFVCPHVHDESYETCEQSAQEDACMLCDLRDLSHCAQTSRRWRKLATNVL